MFCRARSVFRFTKIATARSRGTEWGKYYFSKTLTFVVFIRFISEKEKERRGKERGRFTEQAI